VGFGEICCNYTNTEYRGPLFNGGRSKRFLVHLTLLTQYYPPEIGAPQARLSELAAHFVDRGHSVTVLTAMPSYPLGKIQSGYGGLLRREWQAGVKIIHTFIYPTQSASLVPRITNYLSFTLSSALVGSVLLNHSDYFLVESPPLFSGISGAWLSKLKRARLIFNVSDLWPESAVRLGILRPDSLSCRLSVWLEKFCYRRAWLITGQSKRIVANIIERFPDLATFHLSNGVDTSLFRPDRSTKEARDTLNSNGKLVVLYAGLHGLAQGLEQVLEAAEILRQESDVQFVLIGDGPEKKSLLQHAKKRNLSNVLFLDPRPANHIPTLIAAADIVLVPLKIHIPGAVPSKLYEAMASARPIVLIAEGEAAELVVQHKAGIIVQPGDIRTLVDAIRTLRRQPLLRRALGENGRRAAEQHFDRAKIASRFIEHLERAL
jgi:glycosyltransferase involved in cell wall biosynthesis